MSIADTVAYVLHLGFAGFWTGSILFFAYAVLPQAREATIRPEPLQSLLGKVTTVSRASALLLLITGGHMAGNGYTVESLTGSSSGHLVLTMVALWLVLIVLVEMGAARMRSGLEELKVRTPEAEARPFFYAAAAVALLLLVDAGLLAGGLANL
jgi:putative copper export protein